jgi:SulP family sulfate permease
MPHRSHLFSLRLSHALREACIQEPYTRQRLVGDLLAGITVGIIAIPLAMALAIASGVPPQYGLYTAIIAGFLIPLTGGSRYNVSGPTAAFVVVLFPIAQKYGFGGLLVASCLAGVILVIMAFMRLGRLIEYIPEAVTLGFTGGIAVILITLQIKDFFGLPLTNLPEHFVDKSAVLFSHLPQMHLPSLTIATLTFLVMLAWPRLKTPVPPHLPAIIIGTLAAIIFAKHGWTVDTIGSRFHYVLFDGTQGQGIPSELPIFQWPWLRIGADGVQLVWSWQLAQELLTAAFAIAMLGAIESLLCAVILDNVSGKHHSANSELLGQGIGNIVAPFFGGISATAAIARSSANFKAGAQSPLAAIMHALVVLLGLMALAPLMAYVPMAVMAALLVMVAWGMSEAHKAVHLFKTAPRGDVLVLLTCFSLTVLFDMVIAITVGIVLAALLFVKEIAATTQLKEVQREDVPSNWRVFKINGPLFFAAADRIFGELASKVSEQQHIILQMESVTMIDAGGLASLRKLMAQCEKNHTHIALTNIQRQPLKNLLRAKLKSDETPLEFYASLDEALEHAKDV